MNEIEKSIDRDSEWRETKKLLKGLYPKWQTSDEQIDTWKEAFGMYNPLWFRDAVKLMYRRYSGENPKPKWAEECFREVSAGYRGIPLGEGALSSRKHDEDQLILAQQEKECNDDRIRAWNNVSKWEDEERIAWADLFKERFPNFASTNDSSDMSTWSKTFCQFVFVFSKMDSSIMDGVDMMPLE